MTGFARKFCEVCYRKEDGGRKEEKNEYRVHKRIKIGEKEWKK